MQLVESRQDEAIVVLRLVVVRVFSDSDLQIAQGFLVFAQSTIRQTSEVASFLIARLTTYDLVENRYRVGLAIKANQRLAQRQTGRIVGGFEGDGLPKWRHGFFIAFFASIDRRQVELGQSRTGMVANCLLKNLKRF